MKTMFSFFSAFILLFAAPVVLAQSSSTKAPKAPKSSRSPSSKPAVAATPSTGSLSTTSAVTPAAASIQNFSVSDFVLVPTKGRLVLSAKVQSINHNFNYQTKLNGQKEKDYETSKGLMVVTRLERGLDAGWAVGGEVGMALGSLTVSRKGMRDSEASGMSDLIFTAKKVQNQEARQLFYGGQFSLSPGEKTWATEKESGNLFSGGHSVSGFVGMQKDLRTHILGAKLRHDILLDRNESFKTANNQKVNLTRSNGNSFGFDGFIEKPWSNKVIGAHAGLAMVQSTDYSIGSGPAKLNLGSDAYNVLNLGAYGRFQMKDLGQVELIPAWTFSKVMGSSGGSYSVEDSTELSNLSLAARWPL